MTRTNKVLSIVTTIVVVLTSSCGSFTTITKSDAELAYNLKQNDTKCKELVRIYSGVAYNLCHLHSDNHSLWSSLIMQFYLFDIIPSAAVDTVLLPLGLYNQTTKGNLLLSRPRETALYKSINADVQP